MPPKAHAILSASSSHRWLHCPPSARLCETYEDKGSDYAAEGTDAHSLCEYKLRKALGMEATDPTEHLTWYNEEMKDCANSYASYILELMEAAIDTAALKIKAAAYYRQVKCGCCTTTFFFCRHMAESQSL